MHFSRKKILLSEEFVKERFFQQYYIQKCFICCPSDSTVSEDAGNEPRTFATSALVVRHSKNFARSHPVKKITL
jgi:hypothetical protein